MVGSCYSLILFSILTVLTLINILNIFKFNRMENSGIQNLILGESVTNTDLKTTVPPTKRNGGSNPTGGHISFSLIFCSRVRRLVDEINSAPTQIQEFTKNNLLK